MLERLLYRRYWRISGLFADIVKMVLMTHSGTLPRDLGPPPHGQRSYPHKLDQLFDHLVGDCEYARRNSEAERPGSLEIDYQFEFGRLHDRERRRLGALEELAGVNSIWR